MFSRSTSTKSGFFSCHPVFTTDEFIAVGKHTKRESKQVLLAYYRSTGRVLNVRRGLYTVVPDGMDAKSYMADPFLVAAKATADAVIAYHSALALHGYTYSQLNTITYLTRQKETKKFDFQGTEFLGVTQPKSLIQQNKELVGIDLVEHSGLDIRVTSIERTLVDCFDRLDLSGGVEEVWRSLELIPYLRVREVLRYVPLLNNAITMAKVGLFLELNKERLHIEEEDITFLRNRRPKQKCYMFRKERGGILVNDWNLIVPAYVLNKEWEEPY